MVPAAPNQKRKRGRPPAAPVAEGDASGRVSQKDKAHEKNQNLQQRSVVSMPEENFTTKKRGRPRKSDASMNGASRPEPGQDPQPPGARRSRRDRRSVDDNPYWLSGSNAQERQEEVGATSAPAKKKQRLSQEPVIQEPKSKAVRGKKTEKVSLQRQSNAGSSESSRQSKGQAPVEERQGGEEPRLSRRGRPRHPNEKPAESNGESAPTSRRENTSKASANGSPADDQVQLRRRGRPSLSGQERQARTTESRRELPQSDGHNKARKTMETSAETSAGSSKGRGRGRPRTSNVSATEEQPSLKAKPKSPPGQRSAAAVTVEKSKAPTSSHRALSKNNRQQSIVDPSIVELDEELSASFPPVPKYGHIEPRTRQVPQSTISAKWLPLDDTSIDTISTIVSDTTRPVLLRLRDREQRYQEGYKILHVFANRLRSKLRKGMPFPPPTSKSAGRRAEGLGHADELNFESTVDSIEALERTLDPILDSIKLLEKEKTKEEAALKEDYRNLTTLEANARSEARVWKGRGRKAHPFAPGKGEVQVEESNRLRLARPRPEAPPNGVFHDIQDDEVSAMSKQIANHMESMRGNLQPIQDVLPKMGKTKAALQGVLQKHLTQQQFETVLLG